MSHHASSTSEHAVDRRPPATAASEPRDVVARDPVARDPVARDLVARDLVARDLVERLEVALEHAELALREETAARARAEEALRESESRHRADAALRESEERFRLLAEHAPLGVFLCDAAGRIVYRNPHLIELTGETAEVASADGWERLLHPEDGARARAAFDAYLADASRDTHADEFRLVRPDGTTRVLVSRLVRLRAIDGTTEGYVGTTTDVTEQRRSEEALRASEGRFRGLIENAVDMVAVLDARGAFLYVSPAHARITGYPEEEFIGANAFERIHPDDLESTRAAFVRALSHPKEVIEVQYRYLHQDGTWHRYSTLGTNLLDDPYVGGVVVNSQDVTARSELEAQLRQVQKLEAVGRLAGGVAHDFNNLLMVIGAHVSFVLETLPGGSPEREEIEAIGEATRRATALTRQLLAFSRKQILKPEVLDLNAVVRGLEPMLRRLIGEDIAVESRLAPRPGAVLADPAQLEQVIINLALNARDAMPAGGRLVIETRDVVVADGRAGLHAEGEPDALLAGGDYVRLTVRDTGVGMSEETRQRAFEPFFTTKEPGKGTGLGLATVYGFVRQSGGAVHVASAPGAGTTIEIDLPRATSDASGAEAAALAPSAARGAGTVLLVEDEPQVRALVRRILARAGYSVIEAAGGAEALTAMHDDTRTVDLVISDMVMPGMSGRAFAQELSRRRPGVRVLFMSGYTDDEIIRRGLHTPAIAFLDKPFTADRLLVAVREAMDTR